MSTVSTLKASNDGSLTSFCDVNGEHYHNANGAWEETEAIYIKPSRFAERLALHDTLHIMDPFFGLGYISLGCMLEFFNKIKQGDFKTRKTLKITAVENDPEILTHFGAICAQFDHILIPQIQKQIAEDLFLNAEALAHKIYYQTQDGESSDLSGFSARVDLTPFGLDASILFNFYLDDIRKVLPFLAETIDKAASNTDILEKPESSTVFHCIFHDPFSPRKMPELWTQSIFEHYHALLSDPDGILFTYSQSSAIRGGIQEAGFILRRPFVDKYPKSGTCGLLNGILDNFKDLTQDLIKLSTREQYLLESRAGLSYVDSKALNLSREEIIASRESELLKTTRPGSSAAIRKALLESQSEP